MTSMFCEAQSAGKGMDSWFPRTQHWIEKKNIWLLSPFLQLSTPETPPDIWEAWFLLNPASMLKVFILLQKVSWKHW